ncbi:MAG: hypothetical protein HYR85_12670 [Planctomycetes bacterium]|nr:hypothetical protein [Planctomycetota bacterium]MBI3844314.1 hypothetical protein [Planctomycetota bacterium]
MASRTAELLAASRLDLRAPDGTREFRPAEKCMWCAILYFTAIALPIAVFRILL